MSRTLSRLCTVTHLTFESSRSRLRVVECRSVSIGGPVERGAAGWGLKAKARSSWTSPSPSGTDDAMAPTRLNKHLCPGSVRETPFC